MMTREIYEVPREQWKTKGQIADYFQIGTRTVTRLMRRKVLPFAKVVNLARFELKVCDEAFRLFNVPARSIRDRSKIPSGTVPRNWRTRRQIAQHLQLSPRTITTLMRRRAVPFVRLGRIIRFDEAECDAVMLLASQRRQGQPWPRGESRKVKVLAAIPVARDGFSPNETEAPADLERAFTDTVNRF